MPRLLTLINSILATLAGLILLFCAVSIGYSIIVRPLGLPSPLWVLQFNEYALIWITFLGTSWLLENNGHVSVQILVSRLGVKGLRVVHIIHGLLGLGVCGIFCIFCFETTWDHWVRGVIDVQSIDVLKAPVMVIIPIGFLLLTLQWILKLWAAFTGTDLKPATSES